MLSKNWSFIIVCLIVHSVPLDANQKPNEQPNEEEFVHLLHRGSQSKRIHLVSEIEKNNLFLLVEEYVNLETWTQSLEFKWHREVDAKQPKQLSSGSVNILVFNRPVERVIFKYSPYHCQRFSYNASEIQSPSSIWQSLLQPRLDSIEDSQNLPDEHLKVIATVLSTDGDSPYLAQIPVHFDSSTKSVAWLFGVSGLWAKAQYPLIRENEHLSKSELTITQSGAWNLDLHKYSITYYFESQANDNFMLPKLEFDKLSMAEVKANYFQSDTALINVIEADFGTGTVEEFERAFKFPAGYNCNTDGLLSLTEDSGDALSSEVSSSRLVELELVAITYKNSLQPEWSYSVDIKSVSLAVSEHPLNHQQQLTMLSIAEDQIKVVHDVYLQVAYVMHANENSTSCETSKVLLKALSSEHLDTADEIRFENGLLIRLSCSSLGHLQDARSHSNLIASNEEELVFESVLDDGLQSSLFANTFNTSVVWHYKNTTNKLRSILTRIDLIMYDEGRSEKLAEIRVNFLQDTQPLSLVQRAKLFDVSSCFDDDTSTMELIVSYPANSRLLDYAQVDSEKVVEQFYQQLMLNSSGLQETEGNQLPEVTRVAGSFNFLRVPKIQLHRTANDLLELHLELLDTPSPLYLFSMVSDTDFHESPEDELMLSDRVEHCASLCRMFRCRMLSYDQLGSGCKLSRMSMERVGANQSRLYHKPMTNLYYMPPIELDSSLAEIFSYLKHHPLTAELKDMAPLSRQRRDVSLPSERPLLSWRISDENGSTSERGHLLIPSKVRSVHVPLTLDVSGEDQTLKIESSFRAVHLNKSYHLNLEQELATTKTNSRLYDCPADNSTYTLRKFESIDLYTCSSLCYNIEEWDDVSKSEQICISLSYCSSKQTCILVVKTDYNFPAILEEHPQHKPKQEVASVDSITNLMQEQKGCFVSFRNYMDNFEGPIRLAPNKFAHKTTENSQLTVNHEWLISFRIDQTNYDEDFQSQCVNRCHDMTKNSRRRNCLALDFCTRHYSLSRRENATRRYEITCNLFLVDFSGFSGSGEVRKLDHIRNLLKTPHLQTSNNTQSQLEDGDQLCNRFLVSHLRDFNHLNHMSLTPGFVGLLEKTLPTLTNVNLDKCASDCAVQPRKCSLFEYCSTLDQETKRASKTCRFYGQPMGSAVTIEAVNETYLSSFHQDCHVYIRKDVASLENLYLLNKQAWGYTLSDFRTIIFILVLAFFPLVASVVLVASEKSIKSCPICEVF